MKPCFGRVCVCTICIDVKLPCDALLDMWDFTRLYAGGQSHVCSWLPNEEGCIHDWYDSGTLESRTCQIFRNGMRLNPRTSMSFYWKFQFSASEPSSEQFERLVYMIADTIVADLWVLGNSRRRHRRWYCLVILGIHRRNHVYSILWDYLFSGQFKHCGIWIELCWTISDALHRFREVLPGSLL